MAITLPANRTFYRALLKLTIPSTIQNVLVSSLNLVDTFMIGQLGPVEVAAVGQANRLFFIFMLLTFAMSSGTAIFTAQYWGKRDVEHIGRVMAIAVAANVSLSLLFWSGGFFFSDSVMKVFTNDPSIMAEGAIYLKIVTWSYPLTAVTMLFAFVLRSLEQVKLPMYASVTALSLNTFLNYCLIFGHFGFPALGVKGAAIATVISRAIEMLLLVLFTYYKGYPVVRWRDFQRIPVILLKQFLVTTWPVIVNEFAWVMGITVYAIVYGRMGTAEVAAINMIGPVEQLASSSLFGLSGAASTMIGNQIGAGREDLAFLYAKRFLLIGPFVSLGIGGLVWLSSPLIVSIFNVPQDVRTLAIYILYVFSSVIWIKMFNMICVVGVLRGGGDTKFSMYMEIAAIWGVGVPLALLGGFVWQFAVYWVFALVQIEELFKMLIGLHRMVNKKWIHNLVNAHDSAVFN